MSKLPCANTMIFKKYPPLKSGPPEISVIQREFRTNEGDDDFATHPPITVDRIVMDVCPKAGNGNTGLPTGAPAVIDNVLQTIDFAYVGVISELYKNGLSYFSGIISNVKYYLGGVLIHSWDIAVEALTEIDLIAGTLLTFVNSAPSNWGLFYKQANGDWLGEELIVNKVIQSVDIGGPAITSYTTGIDPEIGLEYMLGVDIQNYSGTSTVGFSASTNGITSEPRLSNDGGITYSFVAESVASVNLFSRSTNQCTFNNISIKELLKSA